MSFTFILIPSVNILRNNRTYIRNGVFINFGNLSSVEKTYNYYTAPIQLNPYILFAHKLARTKN